MWAKVRTVALAVIVIAGMILFTAYLQTNPTMCDGMGFPVCTGSPD